MGSMLPYIAAPWIHWDSKWLSITIAMRDFGAWQFASGSDLWLVYDNVRAMYLCLVSATPKLGPSMAASHSVTISPSACRMRYLAVAGADALEILPLFWCPQLCELPIFLASQNWRGYPGFTAKQSTSTSVTMLRHTQWVSILESPESHFLGLCHGWEMGMSAYIYI